MYHDKSVQVTPGVLNYCPEQRWLEKLFRFHTLQIHM